MSCPFEGSHDLMIFTVSPTDSINNHKTRLAMATFTNLINDSFLGRK
ncbi:hypothetical protein [Acinetobacter phage vB_AbaM_BP10]|nr:hypothetical protein [Acinetobacter phage vB_AbaM_BP10]